MGEHADQGFETLLKAKLLFLFLFFAFMLAKIADVWCNFVSGRTVPIKITFGVTAFAMCYFSDCNVRF